MSPSVHYLWLVGEQGFLQSHQITTRTRSATLKHLKIGLAHLERRGEGAALVEVTLDAEERTVLSVSFQYNALASAQFRRHIERRRAQWLPGPVRALPPSRPTRRRRPGDQR